MGGRPAEDTHYILIIHGTWNAPRRDSVPWYYPGNGAAETFCDRLATAVANTPLSGAAWRPLKSEPLRFKWSGDNTHEARIAAGRELADLIARVIKHDGNCRIHLVGHSHGGNVILTALSHYHDYLLQQAHDAAVAAIRRCVRENKEASAAVREALAEVMPQSWRASSGEDRKTLNMLARRLKDAHARNPRAEYTVQVGRDGMATRSVLNQEHAGPHDGTFDEGNEYSDDAFGGYGAFFREWERAWIQSPITNRVGGLVFLGTPFFKRRWRLPATTRARIALYSWRWVRSAVIGAPLHAIIAFIGTGMLIGAVSLFSSPGANSEFEYPWPLFFVVWALGALIDALSYPHEIARNLYSRPPYPWLCKRSSIVDKPVMPYPALSITGGVHDEVYWAHRAGPLAYAFLAVEMRRLFAVRNPWRTTQTTGRHASAANPLLRLTRGLLGLVGGLGLGLFWLVAGGVIDWMFRRLIVRSVESAVFGLGPGEFDDGHVVAESTLGSGGVFAEKVVAIGPPEHVIRRDASSRRERLVDTEPTQALWSRLEPGLRRALKGFDPKSEDGLPGYRRLLGLVEEQARSLVGVVNLTHWIYSDDESVVGEVAAALVHWDERPRDD